MPMGQLISKNPVSDRPLVSDRSRQPLRVLIAYCTMKDSDFLTEAPSQRQGFTDGL